MVLTFNCKREGQCYVFDQNQEAQYIVKAFHGPGLSGGVYDNLGLSCLIGIEEKENGFYISAFDTPLGVFEPGIGNTLFKMQGEGWEILEVNGEYRLLRSGESIAEITVNGTAATLTSDNGGQVIMVIAAALVVLEHTKKTAASPKAKKERLTEKEDTILASQSRPVEKAANNNGKIISVDWVALKALFTKENIKKTAKNASKLVPEINFKVKGKALIACVVAIAVCLGVFVTGLVVTAKRKTAENNLEWTTATVDIVKINDKEKKMANFSVGDYDYSMELKGYSYKDGETFTLYYTQSENGLVKDHYMKKPGQNGYLMLSIFAIILAVVIFVFMFIGNPFKPDRIQNFKRLIRRLRPAPAEEEDKRYVESDAYVSSTELEETDDLGISINSESENIE